LGKKKFDPRDHHLKINAKRHSAVLTHGPHCKES
jgi:hypothetical protein